MREIAPEVVRIPTGIANAFLIGSRKSWTLLDTGTAGYVKKIRRAAEERFGRGARPDAIVLTHGHFDHAGSAAELADVWDVPVLAHKLEIPFLDGREKYPPPDPTVGGFMSFMIRFFPNKAYDLGNSLRELKLRDLPMRGWRAIHTPGHTPGHVSFYREKDDVLLAGDAFTTINQDNFFELVSKKPQVCRPPVYYTTDWDKAQHSVRELASLDIRVIGAGHGEPMFGRAAEDGLRRLASNFPSHVPHYGRYVREPARSNARGLVYVPPPVFDPVKAVAITASAVTVLGVAGKVVTRRRAA